MPDACAPGWRPKPYTHNSCIMYGKRTFPSFPKHDRVDVGHIKRMIKHLGIDMDCARQHLKVLQG